MAKNLRTLDDPLVLKAALEGLELQKQRLETQIREVRSRLGRSAKSASEAPNGTTRKRVLSPEARKRIAAAQKKRWAEYRKASNSQK
jgi:predicted  nucleic acid-binding Zn-ribbon protein